MPPVYDVEVTVQDSIAVDVLVVGNSVTIGAKTVVDKELRVLPDITPLGPNYTVDESSVELRDTASNLLLVQPVLPAAIVPVQIEAPDGVVTVTDADLLPIATVVVKSGGAESEAIPNSAINLLDTAGNPISTNSVPAATPSYNIEAPDATVNIQKQDSTPANVGAVIPVTAKSNETLAVNVPVSDSTVNVQRKDTAGGLIGAVIPVAVKAEATLAQDIEAPDGLIKDTDGITSIPIRSGETKVLANTTVKDSDDTAQLYQVAKLSDVNLPSIRLTVGATDHDYETSAFTYAAGRLTRVIDDIAVGGDLLTKSANLYEANASARTSVIHPWYIEVGDTKSLAARFKANAEPISFVNHVIFTNRRSDSSSLGLRLAFYPPGIIGVLLIGSAGLTQVNYSIPTNLIIGRQVWNSVVVTFNNTRAANVSVYLNGVSLSVSSIVNDTLTSGTCATNSKSGINAEYLIDDITINSAHSPKNLRFGELQMIDTSITASQALEFHERRRADISDFSYSASIAHRYLARDSDISGLTFTDEVTGLYPFTVTNGPDSFNNYDAA